MFSTICKRINRPYGVYQPCCMAYFERTTNTDEDWEKLLTKKDLKNVRTDSFSDYYRSNYMTKVRDAFRKGDKEFLSDICKQCIHTEKKFKIIKTDKHRKI